MVSSEQGQGMPAAEEAPMRTANSPTAGPVSQPPQGGGSSRWATVALLFSISAASLLILLPVLLIAGAVVGLLLVALLAPALDSLGALRFSTWESSFLTAAATCLAMIGASVLLARTLRRWPKSPGRRFLLWLHVLLAVFTGMAVLTAPGIDRLHASPFVTAIVATPALVVLIWTLILLPLALLRLGAWTVGSVFRLGSRTPFRAGLASGLLLAGSCNTLSTCAADDPTTGNMPPIVYASINYLHEQAVAAFQGWPGGAVDGGRRWLKALAGNESSSRVSEPVASVGALGLWRLHDALDLDNVERCFSELGIVAAGQSDRRNVDIAVAWLIRYRRYTVDDAEDLVQATMLRVCEKAGAGEISGDLGPYFMNAVKGNDSWRRRTIKSRATCSWSPEGLAIVQDRLFRVSSLDEGSLDISRVLCALEEGDARLLDRLVEGWTSEEIAQDLGVGAAAVRKRIERLRARLSKVLDDQHRRHDGT